MGKVFVFPMQRELLEASYTDSVEKLLREFTRRLAFLVLGSLMCSPGKLSLGRRLFLDSCGAEWRVGGGEEAG